jgi:hypothetical protein
MTVLRTVMIAAMLAWRLGMVDSVSLQAQKKNEEMAAAMVEFAHNAFELREFTTEGKKPTLDTLDEFLDIAEFNSRDAANGWRRFDMKYQATTVAFYVTLSPDARTLWLRLDLTIVKDDASGRRMLASHLNAWKNPGDGEYRMADDSGVLSIVRSFQTSTVSAGDIRGTARAMMTQAEGSASTWRQKRSR